ncbi:MAG: helicase-related protein [Planctomycetota bacterium]
MLDGEERRATEVLFDDLAQRYQVEDQPLTRELRFLASHGVLYHHAGLLPIHKEIVERMFNSGRIKLLFCTETFALGVNMPARCVIFDSLQKFDGVDVRWLKTRDYLQMAGRAGRQGIDEEGLVLSRLDRRDANSPQLQRLLHGDVEPVYSRFNLSYSTLLNLHLRLGRGVYDAYERSFARYQAGRRGGAGAPRNRVIARRMRVLQSFGYLDREGVTPRGELARMINGYEVQITELHAAGILESLSVNELAAVFVAILYEARKGDETDPRPLPRVEKPVKKCIRAWRKEEKRQGLSELVRRPDFGLNAVAIEWAKGAPFEDLLRMTTASEGDLVRTFRMALQQMRQLRGLLGPRDPLRSRLRDAVGRMDRDVVDARRQLELG